MGKRGSYEPEGGSPAKRSRHSSTGGRCTVFVGNLAPRTSWQDLKDHMRRAGNVDSANILKTPSGASKGCALVDYQEPREAQRAVRELHHSMLHGNRIDVREDQHAPAMSSSAGNHTSNSSVGTTSLYVGNLSYDCTWQILKDEFKRFGPVEHADIATLPNGRSKGYGLVRMAHARDADQAIRQLDGVTMQGRPWLVRLDHQQQQQHRDGGDRGGDRSGGGGSGTSLYVGNLSYDCSWQDLKDHFRQCGAVSHAEVVEGPDGRKKGFGIVTYHNSGDAQAAIRRFDEQVFQGRPLLVRLDRKDGTGGGATAAVASTFSGKKPAGGGGESDTIYVKNLSFDTTATDLEKHFAKAGRVEHAEVMVRDGGTKSKGWGLVRFAKTSQAERAVRELGGKELQGRPLEVRLDFKSSKKSTSRGSTGNGSNEPKPHEQQEPEEDDYDHEMALDTALKSSR